MTSKYTQNDGSTAYEMTGLSVELLKFVCEVMNLTTIFLEPSQELNINSYVKVIVEFEDGVSDVIFGIIPLMPVIVTSTFDPSIPYLFAQYKLFVPCPKAIPGTEMILTTFSLFVWLSTCLVLLLNTAVFWCAGNGPYRPLYNETQTYQSLSYSFQNAWAVLVGVPQQPTNSNLRVFFFLYVCFCFAINTVFQAFFVSYLVDPKYEKKIETLDELVDSYLVLGYNQLVLHFKETVSYPEITNFFDRKIEKEVCLDIYTCLKRKITKRDMTFPCSPIYAAYSAREMGIVDVGKTISPLDEDSVSGTIVALLRNGSPLLDRFNILMRRYLEAGLLELLWAELQHRAALIGEDRLREADGDTYFAFSVSHILPAFVVLLVGSVLSSVVFIVEFIVNCPVRRKEKSVAH